MQEATRLPSPSAPFGRWLVQALGGLVIACLTGLSMWAVGTIQLESHPDNALLRYWYLAVFLALEAWVCLGLLLSSERLRQGRWLAAITAFAIWCLATGLSALQENRFHTYFDSAIDAEAAPLQLEYTSLSNQVAELEAQLEARIMPSRSVDGIRAELDGYEARADAANYPTKITGLRAELRAAEGYADLSDNLSSARSRLVEISGDVTENTSARKVGQVIILPGITLSEKTSVWILIGTMIAIKALGPWLLFASRPPDRGASAITVAEAQASEPDPDPDPDWEMVERRDRHGNLQRVKVPRAAVA